MTSYTHTLALIITSHHACCYDEIKGTQDVKIYSHADSLILALALIVLCAAERLLELAQSIFEEADVDKSGEVEAGASKGSVLHAVSHLPS